MKRYYVYTLKDPDGVVFYVGKGSKDTAEINYRKAREGSTVPRHVRIRQIWADDQDVLLERVFWSDDSEEAEVYARRLRLTVPPLELDRSLPEFTIAEPDIHAHARQATTKTLAAYMLGENATNRLIEDVLAVIGQNVDAKLVSAKQSELDDTMTTEAKVA